MDEESVEGREGGRERTLISRHVPMPQYDTESIIWQVELRNLAHR